MLRFYGRTLRSKLLDCQKSVRFYVRKRKFVPNYFETPLPVNYGGSCHKDFEPVCQIFKEHLESGFEPGAAFSVYYAGEKVIDVWGGYADVEAQRPWREDTMTQVFSVSKGVSAIVLANMVDKGLLDYKEPVYKYWPEFAQKNKKNITVEMLLSHQGGLTQLSEPLSLRDFVDDPQKVERVIAAQETAWPAGEKFGYHATTYGMYVDMLAHKVDPKGRYMAQIFQEDFAEPYGLDIYTNAPKDQIHRVARMHFQPIWKYFLQSISRPRSRNMFMKVMGNPSAMMKDSLSSVRQYNPMGMHLNDPHTREATMTSVSAHATARGIAKLYGILVKDGPDQGSALLSKEGTKRLATEIVSGADAVIGMNVAFAVGTALKKDSKGTVMFGHPGYGGSFGIAHPEMKLGIGYVTNHIGIYGSGDDPRYVKLEKQLLKCIENISNRSK